MTATDRYEWLICDLVRPRSLNAEQRATLAALAESQDRSLAGTVRRLIERAALPDTIPTTRRTK